MSDRVAQASSPVRAPKALLRTPCGKSVSSVDARLAQFTGRNYLNLESYRKSGKAVRTPLWFARDEQFPWTEPRIL